MIDTDAITKALSEDGWALTYTCSDEGDWKRPSVWQVTLTRHGASLITPYTKGTAYRRWKDRSPFGYRDGFVDLGGERGQKVAQRFGRLTICQAEAIDKGTEPEPPTLDEVVWSVLMDASGVRDGQLFEEWALEYGYDSDSIKARKIFDACRDEWSGLVRLGADFESLDTLFEDY